ncbi:MAG: DUF2085 domain-containing protein [Anaerolineae bacterium]|jgi:uncharacterized membrane protein|nr:DUF2085 domain-containing protein [Anaerolineae bacterium]MBT7072227.1 DUF2085 domain-containing protein [Anaerolineae bacterium]MBT7323975.1 DUF2085 domain-containing protein [Anaerolineae bacterium]
MQKNVVLITKWIIPLAALIAIAAYIYISPPGLLGKADAVGYAICHRIDARSFHIHDRQLPMCARDTGTFTSAAISMLYVAIIGRKRGGMPAKKIGVVLISLFLIWGFDGANSYLYLIKETYSGALPQIPNLYIPNNTLRLLTGSGMGMGMATVLHAAFNQTAWKEVDMRPALGSWRDIGLLVAIMLFIDLLILTESPFILYPVTYISVFGVLMLLTMIFSVVWIMVMRQDNSFTSAKEMWIALLAGFTLALIMIIGIDLLRLQMTGTWGAFPLG